METGQAEAIPTEMEEVRQQFESWRSAHAHRSRIPETLWTSAVKLARQHGLHRCIEQRKLYIWITQN